MSTKWVLPKSAPLRLIVFGTQVFGDRWKASLARAIGVSERVVKYWARDHCPEDLDKKLLAAVNKLIAENHEKAALLASFQQQLIGRLS